MTIQILSLGALSGFPIFVQTTHATVILPDVLHLTITLMNNAEETRKQETEEERSVINHGKTEIMP